MTTTYHICQDLQGALDHWKDRDWIDVCKDENGRSLTPKQVKKEFVKYLAEGKRVIPFGYCSDFDYQTGCRGHPD